MGQFIVKLDSYYLEWSTVSDAPATWGVSLEDFKENYRGEYGNKGMRDLPGRLARVDENGSSAFAGHFDTEYNRAGLDESCLTRDELIEWYCIKKEMPK